MRLERKQSIDISRCCRRLAALVALLMAVTAGPAAAQFRIYYWENFEATNGRLPDSLIETHAGALKRGTMTRVFDYSSGKVPAGMVAGTALTECQRFGLRIDPSGDNIQTGLVHQKFLNRDRLGTSGCALVQADVFIPAEGQKMSNVGLLACTLDSSQQVASAEKKSKYFFYRFGLSQGGSKLFFSFTNGGAKPDIYVDADAKSMNLKRPGWNRFQMVFYGQDKIYCAVNAKFTSFSPITDTTLKQLSPGLMVTTDAVASGPVFADNLSIQWTPYPTPNLPESPWTRGSAEGRSNPKLIEADSAVNWRTNTESAWSESQKTRKPILVLFYIPSAESYTHLSNICPNDAGAKAFFGQFVPLRIDINQLGGGQMAERFGVFRTPMLMVMNADGKAGSKIVVENGKTTWADVTAAIKR